MIAYERVEMKQWCATILLLLTLLPNAAQTQPIQSHPLSETAADSPLRAPDPSSIALVPAAPSAGPLSPLPIAITPAPPFSSGESATFAIAQDARSVLGRLTLTPTPPSAEKPLRLLLHGQTAEAIALDPGTYRLRAWFWRPGAAASTGYPHTTEFLIQPGQSATLSISRAHYSAIKAWLRRTEEIAKKQDPLTNNQPRRDQP